MTENIQHITVIRTSAVSQVSIQLDKNTSHQRTELFCNLGLHKLWDSYNGMQTSPSKLVSILKGCGQIYLLLCKTGTSF